LEAAETTPAGRGNERQSVKKGNRKTSGNMELGGGNAAFRGGVGLTSAVIKTDDKAWWARSLQSVDVSGGGCQRCEPAFNRCLGLHGEGNGRVARLDETQGSFCVTEQKTEKEGGIKRRNSRSKARWIGEQKKNISREKDREKRIFLSGSTKKEKRERPGDGLTSISCRRASRQRGKREGMTKRRRKSAKLLR